MLLLSFCCFYVVNSVVWNLVVWFWGVAVVLIIAICALIMFALVFEF